MSFSFGSGGFTFGAQEPAPVLPNPLDGVEYTGDVERDSLLEWDALLVALQAVEQLPFVAVVFQYRDELDKFLQAWHLERRQRNYDGTDFVRALSAAPAEGAFEFVAPKLARAQPVAEEHKEWVRKSKREARRYFRETDTEFYVLFEFPDWGALNAAVEAVGLSEARRFDLPGGVALSGPSVDEVLRLR